MADSSNYKPTPKAQEILDTLIDVGDWIGRSDLANRLNKKVLNKWDIILLSKMTEAGLIESRQIPHLVQLAMNGSIAPYLITRVKPEDICSNA